VLLRFRILPPGEIYPDILLNLTIQSTGFYFFSDQPAEIKIGDEIEEGSRVETVSAAEGKLVTTRGVYLLPNSLVKKIGDATTVTIRIRFEAKPPLTWEVPAGVLSDWKRFFRTAERWLGNGE